MALIGPIIIVDDDISDADAMAAAIRELGIPNEIIILHTAQEGYDYLCATSHQPLVILCDIRMPGINGLAFRKGIVDAEHLHRKSIPFIFFTAAVSPAIISEAYSMDVQGFFEKPASYQELKDQLLSIFMYWKQCRHPNA